jgi:Ca-activated chloride channel family protein
MLMVSNTGASSGASAQVVQGNVVSVGGSGPTQVQVVSQDQGQVVSAQGWIGGGSAVTVVPVATQTETHVGVWIDVPQVQVQTSQRPPMDLSLVIDASGSMSSENRLGHAKIAASSLLETLHDGDIVSVYAFSDQVYEFAAPTVVSAQTRASLMQAVDSIQTMGGTNLHAGLSAGEARVMSAPPSHSVRRVIVISDGMANIGPSSPEELGMVAAMGTDHGVQVSAIGVGLQYDERTLGALTIRSSGRLYHLEQPSQMATILRTEFDRLQQTVASDAFVEFVPAQGVQLMQEQSMPGQLMSDGRYRVPLGSLFSGQHRELLVRTRITANRAGNMPMATARLVYHDPSGAHAEHAQTLAVSVNATQDSNALNTESARDARVGAMVASNVAAQSQLRAVQMLNEGHAEQAAQQLQEAERSIRQAQAIASAAPASVRLNLDRQMQGVQRSAGRAREAVARPAAARSAALSNNADAFGAMGY